MALSAATAKEIHLGKCPTQDYHSTQRLSEAPTFCTHYCTSLRNIPVRLLCMQPILLAPPAITRCKSWVAALNADATLAFCSPGGIGGKQASGSLFLVRVWPPNHQCAPFFCPAAQHLPTLLSTHLSPSLFPSRRTHTVMPRAEWRLFLPNADSRRAPAEARTLMGMVDHVPPAGRTDVYLKADADIGVKRRVSKRNAAAEHFEPGLAHAVKDKGSVQDILRGHRKRGS